MANWIWKAWTRGIVTSRYPAQPPQPDEAAVLARPPTVEQSSVQLSGKETCPTGAISSENVDQGKCIRCARCVSAGWRFTADADIISHSRGGLVWAAGRPASDAAPDDALPGFERSIHVFLIDVGSCNACNLEVSSLANPYYDSQRLGVFFTNSPRHADVLLVVGVPTETMREPLQRAYEAMPGPKAVVLVGACPIEGGIFREAPGVHAKASDFLAVDVYVPGCPPAPVAILNALRSLVGRERSTGGVQE